jgi:glycosyltransferase involved in cell wall biosynthesis
MDSPVRTSDRAAPTERVVRIAFDIAALTRGGAERQTLEVASGLRERGHDVLLIVNKRAGYDEYAGRVKIVELGRSGRYDLRVVTDIRRTLRAFRPDVCVCVNFNASLWGRMAAASLGCRVVVAEHSATQAAFDARATNVGLRPVTQSVIACAAAQRPALVRSGHPADRIVVVRNGVDTDHFKRDDAARGRVREELGIPADALVVGLVAAHRAEKRHDRFIAIIERLDDAGVVAWGLMSGGGPLVARTAELARASRVSERLRVTGPRIDMPAVYSAIDVVVLVTDVPETFPLCFIEAQACGVPVVGPDAGGIRETMVEGVTGAVADPGDPTAFAARLAGLLNQHERLRAMGDAGHEFVTRELSRDAMIDGYDAALAAASRGLRLRFRGAGG